MYPGKVDSSIGAFWGASLFVGVLVTVIIGKNGNGRSDWLWAILIGVIVFLIIGLTIQGILTLLKK
ncbi:hypothetical protein SFBM_0808 [Candidatus Arthromitus sp. SFB-mouse-Japan]|uniref:hypothetical protein n=1 Tax=Candidatus Arthromitus sp. SFB-mouse TaxID=49118 RepID=UPI00021B7CFD|nr:hypothetical protein [Candidatus Arthromitus sp. SFB-mouse]EIA22263.1 hypothetical protein SFB1_297G4 [Candidatus Arthromitus sp. SFB-1]EIA23614.1 hypothetical protein SFB3_258G3 [Candidatus Arthromitus sp. SFB-3]EIA27439.1 hypothetical protein SFB6_106G25 [Candidatus Arthromitus sp. SFB-co]EIA30847.1 hypothetical protein SFBSU_006G528 [Candidatus Arthromitus sp. SFB-mouse-SU]EGX28746.1 hypothetical protein SFBNYU_007720 [Candidatus Arthromitus sp. SFB-mouse-NYU]